MRQPLFVLSAVIGILTMPGISNAACRSPSGNGTWDVYSTAITGATGWNRCSVTVSNGVISGLCFTDVGTSNTVRGTLSIATNCRVLGTLTHTFPGGTQYKVMIKQATLGAANAVIMGVGNSTLGQAVTFQGLRR